MYQNTQNYDDFGHREREIAQELLSAYGTHKDKTKLLSSGIKVEFNPYSANVFLVDEDYNVAMMNGNDELEDFISCPNCGHEEMASDFISKYSDECCQEYADELGLD